jgi:hypothetical protein
MGGGILKGILCLLFLTTSAWGAEAPLAVRLLVANSAPYAGEEVVLTMEVRHHGRPQGRPSVRWPLLDHFTVEELPSLPPRREEDETGTILVESARRLLRPLIPGRHTLSGGVDLGGTFTAAPELELRVRPLPDRGRPPDFDGAVGEVDLELKAEGTGTREIAVILRGNAPLRAFASPRVAAGRDERLIPLGEVFSGVAGKARDRTFRYLFLPGDGRRGNLAASLPLFDPRTGRYRMLGASISDGSSGRGWAGLLAAMLLCAGAWFTARRRKKDLSLEAALSRVLGRPSAGLCRERILAELGRAGVRKTVTAELAGLWEAEDRARFGGRSQAVETAEWRRRVAAGLRNDVDKSRPIP